ncbi:MAG TPA: glycerophosphodiester phosphodiesterase [Anaerolineae bacterium]|nr:glycerophosphodiester phosphodiesterase [Anaerolineae bacterium]
MKGAEGHRGRILVVGHRGAEAVAPENTWAALRAGFDAGADWLEIDVQLTRDGEAILYHDFTLYPKLRDPRWVRDLAWEELRGLDVGRWYGAPFAGEQIPRFGEVLEWARGRVGLQVDLKHGFQAPGDDRLESAALEAIDRAGMAGEVVLSSWDEVALMRVHARRPEMALAVNLPGRVADPAGRAAAAGACWVMAFWPQLDAGTVVRLREAGCAVCLNNLFTSDYREAVRLGVDAVTAADPGAARAALDQILRFAQDDRLGSKHE